MEHRAVADPAIESGTRNVIETYLDLGRSAEGATVSPEEGFIACDGPLQHPICNFAICTDPTPQVLRRIRMIGEAKPAFSAYLMPPNDCPGGETAMEMAGFFLSHRLSIMWAEHCLTDRVDLLPAKSPGERCEIADFMVDQFFHRQPTAFRRGIAEATSRAASLELLAARWNERTAGAVMISEHGDAVGIYNLCVAPSFRNLGWGSSIVRTVAEEARLRGYGVTLQCEPGLASWYVSLGFREVGTVSVFGLYRFKEIDIIG